MGTFNYREMRTMRPIITSCPRDADYLWACVNSLTEMGYESPLISYDAEKRGAAVNFIEALELGLSKTDQPYLLIVQDDAIATVPSEDTKREIHQAWSDSRDVISLYTFGFATTDSFITPDIDTPIKRASNCCGGCAFSVYVRLARQIIEIGDATLPTPMMIGEVCHRLNQKYTISGRNYFDHIGEVSSIRKTPYPMRSRET